MCSTAAQDCQIALWEFCPDDVCTLPSAGGTRAAPVSSSADTCSPKGKRKGKQPANDVVLLASQVRALLAPAPRRSEVLRLAPVMMQQVGTRSHAECASYPRATSVSQSTRRISTRPLWVYNALATTAFDVPVSFPGASVCV